MRRAPTAAGAAAVASVASSAVAFFVPMLMLGLCLVERRLWPQVPLAYSSIKKQETIDIKIEKGKVSEA